VSVCVRACECVCGGEEEGGGEGGRKLMDMVMGSCSSGNAI
jgi:hypothetical protein